jgi:hypothetical protein
MEIDHVPIGSRVYRALLQSTPCGVDLVVRVRRRRDAISGWFDGDLRAWLRPKGRASAARGQEQRGGGWRSARLEAIDLSGAGWIGTFYRRPARGEAVGVQADSAWVAPGWAVARRPGCVEMGRAAALADGWTGAAWSRPVLFFCVETIPFWH